MNTPLTVEQVWNNDKIMVCNAEIGVKMETLIKLVRAVEQAHGIVEPVQQSKSIDQYVTVNTADMTPPQLDWAVAALENYEIDPPVAGRKLCVRNYEHEPFWIFMPSVDWSHGGPIKEQMHIGTEWTGTEWCASDADGFIRNSTFSYGPTELIAAMRCYVTSKHGDKVCIPTELA